MKNKFKVGDRVKLNDDSSGYVVSYHDGKYSVEFKIEEDFNEVELSHAD